MQFLPVRNTRLLSLLQNLTDTFFNDDAVKNILNNSFKTIDQDISEHHPVSDEYLKKALELKLKDYGFPRAANGFGMGKTGPEDNWKDFIPYQVKISSIGKFLGSPYNALTMLYPNDGYIGWHHNGNASGYNILLTYSQDGNGCFKYYRQKTKEIIELPDIKGWSAKVGYYPNDRTETEKVYWHSAKTEKARISIAWILNHKKMWENMIADISNNDFDRQILKQEHMS